MTQPVYIILDKYQIKYLNDAFLYELLLYTLIEINKVVVITMLFSC